MNLNLVKSENSINNNNTINNNNLPSSKFYFKKN